MIQMSLVGVRVEIPTNQPIVLLREEDGQRYLPIFIGPPEATAIVYALQGMETPRPMTHDLLSNLLEELQTRVDRVVINELKDNTFFARIHLSRGEETWNIDSRPSDAMALALRAQAEIYVEEDVLEKSKSLRAEGAEPDPERLRKWLEEVSPEDLGKYKM